MAKTKSSKVGNSTVPHKHLHSRLSYLHQAAAFLATTDHSNSSLAPISRTAKRSNENDSQTSFEASRLLTHLRGVSRKSQIRLDPLVKRSICKRCDTLLIPGSTSSELIVNRSKDGQKPWADLFEIRCNKCGTIKRFPVGKNHEKNNQEKSVPLALSQTDCREEQMPVT